MKKIITFIISIIMVMQTLTVCCFAESTTTLTTTVPAATYTLNIPASQEIKFGAEETNIGNVTVTESAGFADGKNLKVTISYSPFVSENVSTTIPYTLTVKCASDNHYPMDIKSGDFLTFRGKANKTVESSVYLGEYRVTGNPTYDKDVYADSLILNVSSEDWGKALAGEYSATITFTCEVVVE